MFESLIVTLITALISGITIIAYRHPDGYKRIYFWLMGGIIIFIFILFFWDVAVLQGFYASSNYIKFGLHNDARKVVDTKLIILNKTFLKFSLVPIVMSYLYLLNYLHIIKNIKK